MKLHYNLLAGRSVERLAALSDGIFAVAMTLLVLDLHGPAREAIHSEAQLWSALSALAPQLVAYMASFLTLGIFWNGQQAQLNACERTDRHITWIHIAFLFAVTLMPFSTRLLAEFIHYRAALLCYWGNIVLLGVTLLLAWSCIERSGAVKQDAPPGIGRAIRRRIVIAQGLYAFGALLCLWDNYAAIAFVIAVQLNFALGLLPWRRGSHPGRD